MLVTQAYEGIHARVRGAVGVLVVAGTELRAQQRLLVPDPPQDRGRDRRHGAVSPTWRPQMSAQPVW